MTQVKYYDRVNRCYISMVIVIVRIVYDEIYDEMMTMIWFVVAVAMDGKPKGPNGFEAPTGKPDAAANCERFIISCINFSCSNREASRASLRAS